MPIVDAFGKHQPNSSTIVILKRNWKTNNKKDTVQVRCPCCLKVTTYKGKMSIFDKHLRHCQSSLIVTATCGCLKEQKIHLEDYHEAKGTNWGDLV